MEESFDLVERLKSPVPGTVKEVNPQLRTTPGLVNKDPYASGWMVRIQPAENIDEELSKLAHGPGLVDWLKKEIEEEVKRPRKPESTGRDTCFSNPVLVFLHTSKRDSKSVVDVLVICFKQFLTETCL